MLKYKYKNSHSVVLEHNYLQFNVINGVHLIRKSVTDRNITSHYNV